MLSLSFYVRVLGFRFAFCVSGPLCAIRPHAPRRHPTLLPMHCVRALRRFRCFDFFDIMPAGSAAFCLWIFSMTMGIVLVLGRSCRFRFGFRFSVSFLLLVFGGAVIHSICIPSVCPIPRAVRTHLRCRCRVGEPSTPAALLVALTLLRAVALIPAKGLLALGRYRP
ncbi:hypothetical protein C8R45DRAFT_1042369 [Mycena sanguinolenta]|nr:hypothetical protein C8R45DRAFT_1042369 [Mycena sanguinolenta]